MSIADQITKAWNNANATVDQYALKAKKAPKSSDLQSSLFETSQQPALPGHGGWNEEAHPRVAKGSQQAHGGQFISKDAANPTIVNEQGPIPLRERKSFAEAMAKQGKTSAEIADAMVKRGIALSDANRLANGAVGSQQKPSQKITDNGRSDDALDDWTNSDEFSQVMNESPRLKSLDQAVSKEIEQGLTGEDGTPAIGPKEKAYLSEMVTAMEAAGHDVPEIVKQKIGYQPKPADRPALEVPKPAENADAKSGDQMGLFGEVANVKPEKPGFKPTLLDQAKQPPLFDKKGDPDQIMMFDDGVTPEDRLLKTEMKTETKTEEKPNQAFKPTLIEQSSEKTKQATAQERITSLGMELNPNRVESLHKAIDAGVNEKTLKTLASATRLARREHIVIPAGRFENLSRGKGWARKGRGESAEWGERADSGGYKLSPGKWTIGSTDGFNRKEQVEWIVKHIKVGNEIWTVAD